MIDYIQKEFIDNGKIKDSNYIIGIDMDTFIAWSI